MVFPLFRTPLLVFLMILRNMGTKEQFVLSLQSEKARKWIKKICEKKTYSLLFDLSDSHLHHYLKFEETTGFNECLCYFHWSNSYEINTFAKPMTFKKCMDVYNDAEQMTITSDDRNNAFLIFMEHISNTFKIEIISMGWFLFKNEQLMKNTNRIVKYYQLKYEMYLDEENDYTLKEIYQIMPSDLLDINYPKISNRELGSLFIEWLAGRVADRIHFNRLPANFNLNALWKVYKPKPDLHPDGRYRVNRYDGEEGIVGIDEDRFEMNFYY